MCSSGRTRVYGSASVAAVTGRGRATPRTSCRRAAAVQAPAKAKPRHEPATAGVTAQAFTASEANT